jgi:hypothetical protein
MGKFLAPAAIVLAALSVAWAAGDLFRSRRLVHQPMRPSRIRSANTGRGLSASSARRKQMIQQHQKAHQDLAQRHQESPQLSAKKKQQELAALQERQTRALRNLKAVNAQVRRRTAEHRGVVSGIIPHQPAVVSGVKVRPNLEPKEVWPGKAPPKMNPLLFYQDKRHWHRDGDKDAYDNVEYVLDYDVFYRKFADYHRTHGREEKWGWYYPGREHHHWSHIAYFPAYCTYLYYEPFLRKYYYWNRPHNAYYPVDYAPDGIYSWDVGALDLDGDDAEIG